MLVLTSFGVLSVAGAAGGLASTPAGAATKHHSAHKPTHKGNKKTTSHAGALPRACKALTASDIASALGEQPAAPTVNGAGQCDYPNPSTKTS
jgi:hypothetical protein